MTSPDKHQPVRRVMDAEDYLDALRRRRSFLFGPLLAGLVMSVTGAYLWPDTYQSSAVLSAQNPILVDPILSSPLRSNLADRIGHMATAITSRTSLETVINTYGLYANEIKRVPIEDVVELMRRNIQISQVQSVAVGDNKTAAFSIRFSYRDRFLAQKVVADLAGRFTTQNLRQRVDGNSIALAFAKSQMDASHARLTGSETKLAEFRTRFQGKLPDQAESSLQQMNALQMRFSMVQNSTARASQELLMLRTNLGIDEEKAASARQPRTDSIVRTKSDRLLAMERQIAALEPVVASMQEQYTERHPDLQTARQQLDRLTKDHAKLAAQEASIVAPEPLRQSGEIDANIRRYRAQIDAKTAEVETLNKDAQRINESIQALDARLQSAPGVEREYAEVLRERDLAKTEFTETETRFRRLSDSSVGENARLFESLDQIDAASLPTEPIEPKRPLLIALGSIVGLLLGFTLVGTEEWRDSSIKNLKDVRTYTDLVVLSSIPEIENDLILRRRKRLELLAWAVAVTFGILLMAGSIGYYYATRA